jgi:hypothetical protein
LSLVRRLTTGFGGHKPGWGKVQLMIQRITDIMKKMCMALWDTGAQISLVTHQYTKEAGFESDFRSCVREQKEIKSAV